MVGLYEVDGPHLVDGALTEEQIKKAILEGADIAGWSTEDLGGNYILATYYIRVHTVQVDISYSESLYSVRYRSSNAMKVDCSELDRNKPRHVIVTGQQQCPGYQAPYYIHGNYKKWVDILNRGIQSSLASM